MNIILYKNEDTNYEKVLFIYFNIYFLYRYIGVSLGRLLSFRISLLSAICVFISCSGILLFEDVFKGISENSSEDM